MLRLLIDSKVSLEGCRSRQVTMFRVPIILGTVLGVPKTRIIVFGGLHWDPPYERRLRDPKDVQNLNVILHPAASHPKTRKLSSYTLSLCTTSCQPSP